jgi:hypothetical protein
MTDDLATPPRFPYVGAVLCAACIGAAAWTWMRYSYAWDVTPADISAARLPEAYHNGSWPYGRRYVRLEGVLRIRQNVGDGGDYSFNPTRFTLSNGQRIDVQLKREGIPDDETKRQIPGRLSMVSSIDLDDLEGGSIIADCTPYLQVGHGRLTGASVAGLVVGAMGVFVFTVALRHWLGERRKFREGARA